MRQILITEEEARAIIIALRSNWVPIDDQKIIYNLIKKLEKELESET